MRICWTIWGEADRKGDMLTSIFEHNLLYWAISKLAKNQFMALRCERCGHFPFDAAAARVDRTPN
jgi:hypothetical protein